MVKRTNIERIIASEIEKGNIYVVAGGNFVSAEMLEKEIKVEFNKAVNAPDFDINMSLATFKENKLSSMRKAEDLLKHIQNFFGEGEHPVTEQAEPVTEPTTKKHKKGVDA